MTVEPPPEHVLSAFGLTGVQPVPLGASWEGGWRCGEVVLSMVADNARAAWSARVRETLFVDGIRLARPVRSTDGRYVVSCWRANTFVAGTPEARHDEVVSAAPGITDITPYWRPASWAAGVVVVDALSWGEADDGLIERWNALPEWPQMLLRALMFRLAVHALHPRSTAEAFPGLARTAALVRLVL